MYGEAGARYERGVALGTVACRICLMACLALVLASVPARARVLLHVEEPAAVKNLLVNPDFEAGGTGWDTYDKGFEPDNAVRHSGTAGIRCENLTADVRSGAYQAVTLNQKTPTAIRATAYSRAEDVGPAMKGEYTLYLDIQYADGTWLWGRTFDFDTGTHDWQLGEVVVRPEKPIKSVAVYVLLRGCTGKVWFDDCLLEELKAAEGRALFDGAAVRKEAVSERKTTVKLETRDGLALELAADGSPTSLLLGSSSLPQAGGFFLRDVAAGSDFVSLDGDTTKVKQGGSGEVVVSGGSEALGLALDARMTPYENYIRVDCEARDRTGRDRAVTIGYALTVPPEGRRWWHSIRSSDAVTAEGVYSEEVPVEAGATGGMSTYPFACLGGKKDSLSLAIPMSEPCVYRIGYNGTLGWYAISFDLGFCPDEGVTRQKFSFLIYRSDGPGGMRAAVKKYYDIFPEYFVKRVEREGNWMAFRAVSAVQGWEDFGFAFHEGDNDIAWDAEHGMYSFRYTEPMSYWLALDKDMPRTPEKALEIINSNLRQTADSTKKAWASAVKLCLIENESGKPRIYMLDVPWCDGALFVMDCNPAIPTTEEMPVNRAGASWGKEIAEKLYGDATKPQLAGEYLDSAEMGAEYVNCRREYFRYAARPLTFGRRTKRPAILQILSTYEFASWMADDVHRRGKLMMANMIPNAYGFMAHLFDVMGIETSWLVGDKYFPVPDSAMDFRRTLCYQKPYCFLMNTDYEKFDHSMVEKYFQRCMFWGIFPGFFSPDAATRLYFDDPKLYNRDRDLFEKYMPVIKKIAAAGWEPVTMARTSDPAVEAERFGPGKDGALYFTVRNGKDKAARVLLRLDGELGRPKSAVELPSGEEISVTKTGGVELALEPGEVAVVEIRR
jgi:hypothetical protein